MCVQSWLRQNELQEICKMIMQCFKSEWKCSIDTPPNEEEIVLELYCLPNKSTMEEFMDLYW